MSKERYDIDCAVYMKSPPERVFQALTDPKMLENWWPIRAKIDPKEGGAFSMGFKNGFVLNGKLSHFKRNKSVSLSWVDASIASFELTEEGAGTLLRLRHAGIEDPDALASYASGWAHYLTNLKSVLDHGIDLRSELDQFG